MPLSTVTGPVSDNLKPGSLILLFAVIILAPIIQDRLSEEAVKYVQDNASAHNGMPTEWDGKQVYCVLFPEYFSHSEYSSGVTMIGPSGSPLGVNDQYNGTGACVGGLVGYSSGMELMLNATEIAGGSLSVDYDVGEWGPYVHTIGGLNADNITGDFNWAWWSLEHNGAVSMVGIGDLVMSEGDVIIWRISTS